MPSLGCCMSPNVFSSLTRYEFNPEHSHIQVLHTRTKGRAVPQEACGGRHSTVPGPGQSWGHLGFQQALRLAGLGVPRAGVTGAVLWSVTIATVVLVHLHLGQSMRPGVTDWMCKFQLWANQVRPACTETSANGIVFVGVMEKFRPHGP